ncbi:asparaginase [Vampirovibrio sp.]|uniref:asparaginase n=1 Tax=Vampirovibrio sp. TaxID=2717857 RepID=UPI0035933FF6
MTAHRFIGEKSTDKLPLGESIVENRHTGWFIISHRQRGILYSTPGATEIATFFRSSAKPFQAFPIVEKGLHPLLTEAELALTCASHTGSNQHIQGVQNILNKATLSKNSLKCGPHPPTDGPMLETLAKSGAPPNPMHNNCSGKHAGMLFYCKQQNLNAETYLNFEHPLQQSILNTLRQYTGIQDIPTAVDGCGAPVFYLPLEKIAALYAVLVSDEAFRPLKSAMINHPQLVGGEGRIDTVLMQASQGKLLAKVGADGVLCVGHTEAKEGLALKIADGSELIRNLTIVEILQRIGWLDSTALEDIRLKPFQNQKRLNTQGKVVGEYQFHFTSAGYNL